MRCATLAPLTASRRPDSRGQRKGETAMVDTRCLRRAVPRMLLCGATLVPSGSASAQTVEHFYRGRTINFLVASAPGGINDLMARLISRHLGNHIPGRPTLVVQNLGSAGLVLANRIYGSAEKDGTAIAIIERGTPQLAIQGDPNARFDPLKMTWLGSVSSYAYDAYIFWVNATFAAKSVADLKQPSTLTARVGTTGAG